jgi:hypothetical protein
MKRLYDTLLENHFSIHYRRDKQKREVDFLMLRDGVPWFLVEAKTGDSSGISEPLRYFHEMLKAPHAFQVVLDLPYENADCFTRNKPIIVPARTFLSQLV